VRLRKVDPAKHEEKRRQILEAAGRCFARSGFRGASISEICGEAKMSPGHLYHYFANKEAIIGAMTESGLQHAAQRVGEMTAQEDVLQALLAELTQVKAKRGRAKSGLMLEMVAEAGRNPAIATILRHHHRALRDLLADYLREGQHRGQVDRRLDADLAAALLLGVFDGVSALGIKDPTFDMEKGTELLQEMIARFLTT
jgi:TetR/AcrR family transcriptional repressor of uid operon